MHLKSVYLQGFKTFAGRTTMELRPGITAVVGPNGSGKSNIADAVRWALGETNLRHVRCRATEELIFAGNARRSSVGLAEVSLVFANDGEWLAVPFTEVKVTRRAYRSGENEYLLNGNRVRLRDIIDLLAGASIHAGGHVVVSQGLVDSVLSLRPEERRPMIENLAGLKQYYLRRDEAEGRLAQTEANLVHVDSVIAEIAPQLESLTVQAQVLRTYRAAEAELQQLQQATFGAQAARLLARRAVTQQRADAALAELDEAQINSSRIRDEDDALLATLEGDRAAREELRAKIAAQTALLTTAQREKDVAAAQALAADERAQFSRAEHERLIATLERERLALDEARTAVGELRAELGGVEGRLAVSQGSTDTLARERDCAASADRDAQARDHEASRLATRLAAAVAASAAAVESLTRELERQEAAAATAAGALEEAGLAYSSALSALAGQEAVQAADRETEQATRANLEAIRHSVATAQSAHRDAVREHVGIATRYGVLKSWLESLDGFDAPTRGLAEHASARGIVAQAIRIDPSWQAPIAALLGSRYESLLCDDVEALVFSALNGAAPKGRVRIVATRECEIPGDANGHSGRDVLDSFWPAPDAAKTTLHDSGAVDHEDVLGWAADICEDLSDIPVRHALRLDRVLLLRDAEALLRCRPHLPGLGLSAIVRGRSLAVLPDGSVVCGIEERASELIRRREELGTLESALGRAAIHEEKAREQLSVEQQRLTVAEQEHERARRALNMADSVLSRARDEARFHERMVLHAKRTASTSRPVTARLAAELGDRHARVEVEVCRHSSASDAAELAQDALATSQSALSHAQQRLSAAIAERRDDELAAARLRDQLSSVVRQEEEQRRRVTNLDADFDRHADRERSNNAMIAELVVARDAASKREVDARATLEAVETELQPLEVAILTREAQYSAVRSALHAVAERLARAQAGYDSARRELESATRETEVLRAQVSAELGCDLGDLPDGAPPHGAVSRVKALRAELAAIGPVNARAEDDLASSEERFGFLRTQAADLRDGVARLRTIIEDANATVRERFTQTVDELDKHFATFFTRLFEGGSCRLVAEYDDLGLPMGVEVCAQPPGKRTRDLALLSGGERALIAMALLFAMLRVRPVPFCLLDEVEAALDEANTGRFGAILKELSATTQFLIVTHNRGTMLHADRLYGITMSEVGVSTAASLELSGLPVPE